MSTVKGPDIATPLLLLCNQVASASDAMFLPALTLCGGVQSTLVRLMFKARLCRREGHLFVFLDLAGTRYLQKLMQPTLSPGKLGTSTQCALLHSTYTSRLDSANGHSTRPHGRIHLVSIADLSDSGGWVGMPWLCSRALHAF